MKDNFLLKTSQINVFNALTDEDAGKLIKGIFEYVQSSKIILEGYLKIIFIPIKEEIDKNQERYEKKCEVNKENGKKGGAPKGNQNAKKQAKTTENNPTVEKTTETTLTRHNHNHIHNHNQLNINNNNNNYTSNNSNNNIFSYIENNFNRLLTPIEYEEISKWEDNELTRYAIKDAVLNGKYNIKYISRILENYKKNSIITVQQAQEDTKRYKEQHKYKTSNERANEVYERFLAKGEN